MLPTFHPINIKVNSCTQKVFMYMFTKEKSGMPKSKCIRSWRWFPPLAAHWNHPGRFTKHRCLGLIPRESRLTAAGCSPGTGIFKTPQLALMCSHSWELLVNDYLRSLRNVFWIDLNFMESREYAFSICGIYSIESTWQAKFTVSYSDSYTKPFCWDLNVEEACKHQNVSKCLFSLSLSLSVSLSHTHTHKVLWIGRKRTA